MNPNSDEPDHSDPQIEQGNDNQQVEPSSSKREMRLPPKRKKKDSFVQWPVKNLSPSEAPAQFIGSSNTEGHATEELPKKEKRTLGNEGTQKKFPTESAETDGQDLKVADEETAHPHPRTTSNSHLPSATKSGGASSKIGVGVTAKSHTNPKTTPLDKIPGFPKFNKTENREEEAVRNQRHKKHSDRLDWSGAKRQNSAKWIVFTGIGVVLFVILSLVLNRKEGGTPVNELDSSPSTNLRKPAEEPKIFDPFESLSMGKDRAKVLYGEYASANAPADFVDHFYKGKIVLPLIEKNWKPPEVKPGWVPGYKAQWIVSQGEDAIYGLLSGNLTNLSEFNAVFRLDGQKLTLDWKATTSYSSASFAELAAGKGDGSEIRAWISPTEFYTFPLPEEDYRSYRLMSSDRESVLWVYTARDSELDQKIMSLFIPSEITGEVKTEAQVTLALQAGPEEGLPDQWMVEGVTSLDWLDHSTQ